MALVFARTSARPAAAAATRTVSIPSRGNVAVKSNSGALLGATAAILLVSSTPAWANTNQFEESQSYEQEMVELIKTRSKGKAVLEVKSIENESPVLTIDEAPVVKASMTADERSEAIRAEAVRQATGATAQIAKSRGASLASRNAADSGNGGAAVLGLALVAAAVGGAYYYQNNLATGEAAATPAGTVSGSAPTTPTDLPTSEREQTPAPTA